MKVNVKYNEVNLVFKAKEFGSVDLEYLLKEVIKDYSAYHSNILILRKKLIAILDESQRAINNLDKEIYTVDSFSTISSGLMVLSPETSKYVINGMVADQYYEQACKEAYETINNLKTLILEVTKVIVRELNIDAVHSQKYIKLINNTYGNIDDLNHFIATVYRMYSSEDSIIKHIIINFITNAAAELLQFNDLQDNMLKENDAFLDALTYLYDRLKNNKKINYELLVPLFSYSRKSNIDFKNTITEDIIEEYNKDKEDGDLESSIIQINKNLSKKIMINSEKYQIYNKFFKKTKYAYKTMPVTFFLLDCDINNLKRLCAMYLIDRNPDLQYDELNKSVVIEILLKCDNDFNKIKSDIINYIKIMDLRYIEQKYKVSPRNKIIYDLENTASFIDLFNLISEYVNSSHKYKNIVSFSLFERVLYYIKDTIVAYKASFKEQKEASKLLNKLSDSVLKESKIDIEVVEKLKNYPYVILDLYNLLNNENVNAYNNSIEQKQALKEALKIKQKSETLEKDVVFNDVDIELTEEDKICIQMYLDIITEVANGNISIDDFEMQTTNYLGYIEGTHYKQILQELIRKIQNSTNISKNVKTKTIKAISALVRTI